MIRRLSLTALLTAFAGEVLAFSASGTITTAEDAITNAGTDALSIGGVIVIAIAAAVTVGLILQTMKKV